MQKGYYRQPTIHKDQIVFLSEDDLWTVPSSGGTAIRLTSNLDSLSFPHLSPDGKWLAFIGRDQGGDEVYVMPASGGEAKRLTYAFNFRPSLMGWTPEGNHILFSSNYGEAFYKMSSIYKVSVSGGLPEKMNLGHGRHLSFGPKGKSVIGRNTIGAERWKRYKGGTAGKIWIDNSGKGKYSEYTGVKGNFDAPMWIGNRIYFLSDHKGIANLYSIKPNGSDIKQHTKHKDFYAKNASTDGRSIVYTAGADLYRFDVKTGKSTEVKINFASPRVQRHKKFITASSYFQGYDIHPDGHSVALNVRGKAFTMANWEGAVKPISPVDGIRKRVVRYMNHTEAQVMVSEDGVKEILEIHNSKTSKLTKIKGLDFGRAIDIKISPDDSYAAIANHRFEIALVNLKRKSCQIIAKSKTGRISGINWSPDSQWLAYGDADSAMGGSIKVYSVKTRKTQSITEGDFMDYDPVFSPDGNYIYFLSARNFNPVRDNIYFDYNFPVLNL